MGPAALGAAAALPDQGTAMSFARVVLAVSGGLFLIYGVVLAALFAYSLACRTRTSVSS